MATEIRTIELANELKARLDKVHNLKKVFIGRSFPQKLKDVNDFVKPDRKQPIAYGNPEIIENGLKGILSSLSGKTNYELQRKDEEVNGNALFVVLDIETKQDYSIDDLDDDDLFPEPFTLIK